MSRAAANKDEAHANDGQSPDHHHIVFLRALRDKADQAGSALAGRSSERDPGAVVDVRLATSTDADFIEAMLVEAATWASDHHDAVLTLADERNAHYVADWPRPNDLGIIACGDDGTRLGAAWLRYFGAADPGYGFVNHDIPELSIGVSRPWRGRGIGSLLLRRLHTEAASRGVRAISLSVERANPAVNLYRRIGYEILTDADDAFTMMIVLE